MRRDFIMAKENGVASESIGFAFTPLPLAEKYYYYITDCGHYHCSHLYSINRSNYAPILIMAVLAGTLYLSYRGHDYHLHEGDVFFIDCMEPHAYGAYNDGLEFIFVQVNGCNTHDICQYLLDSNGCFIHHSRAVQLRNLIDLTVRFYDQERVETAIQTSVRAYTFLSYLHESSAPGSRDASSSELIMRFVDSHIDQQFSLDDLSAEVHLSKYYFSRIFKKETGYTLMEYITMKKLDYAKTLLAETDVSVSSIAENTGYTLRGFINLFSAHNGCSPSAFRKLMKNAGQKQHNLI